MLYPFIAHEQRLPHVGWLVKPSVLSPVARASTVAMLDVVTKGTARMQHTRPSQFQAFRHAVYASFSKQAGALQNLLDGLLTQDTARSLPELALAPVFTRQWPSVYTALQDGQIDAAVLQRALCQFVPGPTSGRLLLGGDASAIPRPHAHSSPDRTYQHVPNLLHTRRPVTPGWLLSQLVVLPDPASSWVYPLTVDRIRSDQTPTQVLAIQLAAVCAVLGVRPVLAADRGYGSAAFLQATASIPCDLLLRVASNRVFYRPAPPRTGKRGRPRLDGARFVPTEPPTYGTPDATWHGTTEAGLPLTVCCWHRLHLKATRDQEVCVVQILRPYARNTQRDPRVSWFLWRGPTPPPLAQVYGWYRRRFGHEHGFRFAKQHLLWSQAHVRTPAQFVRWSQLVAIAQATLYLARGHVTARRLPWHKSTAPATPQQLRRGIAPFLAQVGSPAPLPRPRGKSPGRMPGFRPAPAPRFLVRKKAPVAPG